MDLRTTKSLLLPFLAGAALVGAAGSCLTAGAALPAGPAQAAAAPIASGEEPAVDAGTESVPGAVGPATPGDAGPAEPDALGAASPHDRVLARLAKDVAFDAAHLRVRAEEATGEAVERVERGPFGLVLLVFRPGAKARDSAAQRQLLERLRDLSEFKYVEPDRRATAMEEVAPSPAAAAQSLDQGAPDAAPPAP